MAEVESAAQGIRVETSEVSAVVRELAVEIEAQRVDAAFKKIPVLFQDHFSCF